MKTEDELVYCQYCKSLLVNKLEIGKGFHIKCHDEMSIFTKNHNNEYNKFMDLQNQLPNDFGHFTFEEIIKLEHMTFFNLDFLPESIDLLKNLKTLDFQKCRLTNLPNSLFRLSKLENLNLNDNRFNELPEVIFKIRRLTGLIVSNNFLKFIPKSITNLHKLHYLDISHNLIQNLVDEIGELYSLEYLNVSNNELVDLPNFSISGNLKTINISNNKFTSLPESIIKLNPINLSISNNKIEKLPKELFLLNNNYSRDLFSNDCGLKSLPNEIRNLNFGELFLSNNRLNSFPELFTGPRWIRALDLSKNPIKQLPENLFENFITHLSINHTNINYLPKIKKGISSIHMKGTPMTEFPDFTDILKISPISLIDIRDTYIEKIPAYIKDYHIKEVYISDPTLKDSFNPKTKVLINQQTEYELTNSL